MHLLTSPSVNAITKSNYRQLLNAMAQCFDVQYIALNFFGLSYTGSVASPSSTGLQGSMGTAEGQPAQQHGNTLPSGTSWRSFSPGDLPEAGRPVSACASHELLCMRSLCDQAFD